MADIPAVCPKCGTMFGSGIWIENSPNIQISGGRSVCPVRGCGGLGVIPTGTYSEARGLLTLVQRDQWGRERILRFREIAKAVAKHEISTEEAKHEIKKIDSTGRVSEFLEKHGWNILAILIALYALYQAHSTSQTSSKDWDRFLAQIQAGQATEQQLLRDIDLGVSSLRDEIARAAQSKITTPISTQSETDGVDIDDQPTSKRRARRQRGKQKELDGR